MPGSSRSREQRISRRSCPVAAFDDDVEVLLRYPSGARGMLWASQVAPGNENKLRLRVYGSKGGIEWRQERPDKLALSRFGQATEVLSRATPPIGLAGSRVTRLPAGHPEGYLEALATIYTEVAAAIRGEADQAVMFPGIEDGIAGVAFIEAAHRSGSEMPTGSRSPAPRALDSTQAPT
ncbi:MAG: Gfo/Idh/MocA family oxidoreductase [Acetobacteraceae bacterium]